MMHSTNTLYSEMNATLIQISKQIAVVQKDTDRKIADLPYPDGVTAYDMRNPDGSYVLESLLAAKAHVLGGMAALKAAEVANKGTGRSW